MNTNNKLTLFQCPENSTSAAIASSILSGKEYPLIDILQYRKIETILDIGANLGAFSVYCSVNFPSAVVHSYEPQEAAFAYLEKNQKLCFGRIHIHQYGLSDKESKVRLYGPSLDDVGCTNSVFSSPETGVYSKDIELKSTVEELSILGWESVDIVKIDTEGCEVPILEGFISTNTRIGVLYIEFHSETDRIAIDQLLSGKMTLVRSRVDYPHRGNLIYVSAQWCEEYGLNKLEIKRSS